MAFIGLAPGPRRSYENILSRPPGLVPRCGPARVWQSGSVIILLDQKDWIGLAKADRRPAIADAPYVEMLPLIRSLVSDRDEHHFPLNASRYHETAKIGQIRQRREVAMIMKEISGFETLLEPARCIHREFVTLLTSEHGGETARELMPILGHGAANALRFELVLDQSANTPAALRAEIDGMAHAVWAEQSSIFEFKILAGEEAHDGSQGPVFPGLAEHEQRFEDSEQRVVDLIRTHSNGDSSELTRLVRGETIKYFLDELLEAIHECGLGLDVLDQLTDRDITLVDAVPGLDVMSGLRSQAFRNEQYHLISNDRYDIIHLLQGIPYVDIVSTDKAWKDLTNRTQLLDRYEARVTGKPSELLATLKEIAA